MIRAHDGRQMIVATSESKEQRAQQNARPPQGVNETHKLCKEAGGRAGVQTANNVPRARNKNAHRSNRLSQRLWSVVQATGGAMIDTAKDVPMAQEKPAAKSCSTSPGAASCQRCWGRGGQL